MTYAKLFGYGLMLALVIVCIKSICYSLTVWDTSFVLHCVFWLLVIGSTVVAVRKLGAITVLESLVVLVLWLIFHVLFDLIFTGVLVGYSILVDPNMAVEYVLFAAVIIIFHNKRHVVRRKELLSK